MESTCPECMNELSDVDTACPRCGTPRLVGAAHVPPLMSVVNEAPPPASPAALLATRVGAVIFVGWLGVLAVLSWLGYREGYFDEKLPIWNSVVVLGMVPIAVGVFRRRLWAQRWIFGTSALTAASTAFQASRADSTLLWAGALLLGAVAIVMAKTKPIFRYDDAHKGTAAQVIAMIALLGSVVMFMGNGKSRGTERGREEFAAEVQKSYAKISATIHVYVDGCTLVIESPSDSDEAVDASAQQYHEALAKHGSNAKAWVLGFDAIKLTNGSHAQRLAPPDAP